MTPQDSLTIISEVAPDRVDGLRTLLATMNFQDRPGFADPKNALVSFGAFETIHFARFVVLADNSLSDRAAYPGLPLDQPIYLCFMADCDGPAEVLLKRLARDARGLSKIFSFSKDYSERADMLGWLRAHRIRPAASYVNWLGRTVRQVRDEARLHALLREALTQTPERDPQGLLLRLRQFVGSTVTLSAEPPTPLGWRLRNLAHFMAPLLVAAFCLVFFPLLTLAALVVAAVFYAVALRGHEQADPIISQPNEIGKIEILRTSEDFDVSNQYSAMGSIKPGRFRLWSEIVILYGVDWAARHIFTRGAFGRIGTIHFAHWAFLDDRRRGFFCSNYDGRHEAYMDDFINKAGFGLNLSFSSFIAYPPTDWLLMKGAWREQEFKRFQRHHQIPTDVWYRAYPGLTARDLARNARIRNGFEKAAMTDDEIRRWVAEI
jgi:hypothetical protein